MSSLYAQYLKERQGDSILETPEGFASYRYLPDQKTVYIVDIFVLSDFRKNGIAASMADTIVAEAKSKGCTKLLGSVVPSVNGSTESLRVLLGYGMRLQSSSQDFIVFEKEI